MKLQSKFVNIKFEIYLLLNIDSVVGKTDKVRLVLIVNFDRFVLKRKLPFTSM